MRRPASSIEPPRVLDIDSDDEELLLIRTPRTRCVRTPVLTFVLALCIALSILRLLLFPLWRDQLSLPTREQQLLPNQSSLNERVAFSLREALSAGVALQRVHCGYGGILGMWNAYPHLKKSLIAAGFATTRGGIAFTWREAAVLVVPNYWKPGAADWRTWRLAPWQRINRLWGMYFISRKETLARTLDEHL